MSYADLHVRSFCAAAPIPLVLDIFFDKRKKMKRGQGKLVVYQFDACGSGAIEAAYHWAMLVEPRKS
jgi:hypothetical protein